MFSIAQRLDELAKERIRLLVSMVNLPTQTHGFEDVDG